MMGTVWLLSQKFIHRKHLQIMAGRWVFVLQFRRPAMSGLHHVWKLIASTQHVTHRLRSLVRQELFQLVLLAPVLHCNLGAGVENHVVVTDASESGCAIASSGQLTPQGMDFLQATQKNEANGITTPQPILVISLFNGIGGAFRSYDIVGCLPMGRIAVECDSGANRICARRWPGTIFITDVREVDRALVRSWSRKYLQVEEVHVWAGFPCTDLSRVKFQRLNLEGPNSSLFWEVPRVLDLVQEEFGTSVKVKHALENVASMDEAAARDISQAIGSTPYLLDPCGAVPMRRPRFAWLSERLEETFADIEIVEHRYWNEVKATAPYPPTEVWIEPGHTWEGERDGAIFPTCMKAIPRERPPPRPAGISRCSKACLLRWEGDNFRYPPYQYEWKYLISTESTWRLLSACEKELLLGYGFDHTCLAWAASKIKQNPRAFDDARHSYLGDSFSIYSFAIVAASLCHRYIPNIPYVHLAQRMGAAPGFRPHVRSIVPLCRHLAYGSPPLATNFSNLQVEHLNRLLLRRTNHTGSDVRVVSGEFTNPKIFPRQSVSASWWIWKDEFNSRWKQRSHINVLELEALLLGLKHQIRRFHVSDRRVVQLTDSYVCISVVSKGRSSSLQLNRVLKQVAALLLAHGLQLIVCHVESSENPTDFKSRM